MRKRIGYLCLALMVMVAWFLLVEIVQKVTLFFCGKAFGMTYLEVYPIKVIVSHICYVLVFGLWYGIGFKKFAYIRKSTKKIVTLRNILGIIVVAIGSVFFIAFGMALIEKVLPRAVIKNYIELMERSSFGKDLLINLTGCLIAPIGEEMVFRGVMLSFLLMGIKGLKKEKILFWVVNLVQALAFGVYHGNLYQFIYTAAFGILLGYIVYKANTVLVSILIHMVYNTTVTLFMNAIGNALPKSMTVYAIVAVAGFVVMMVGVLLVKRAEEEPEKELSVA